MRANALLAEVEAYSAKVTPKMCEMVAKDNAAAPQREQRTALTSS